MYYWERDRSLTKVVHITSAGQPCLHSRERSSNPDILSAWAGTHVSSLERASSPTLLKAGPNQTRLLRPLSHSTFRTRLKEKAVPVEHQSKPSGTKQHSLRAEVRSATVRYRALPTTGKGAGPAQLYSQRPRLSLKLGLWEKKKKKRIKAERIK